MTPGKGINPKVVDDTIIFYMFHIPGNSAGDLFEKWGQVTSN